MVYRSNPVDKLGDISDSSGPIMENFFEYKPAFAVNHIDINDPTDAGKHFQIDLTAFTSAPSVSGTDGQILNLNAPNNADGQPVLPFKTAYFLREDPSDPGSLLGSLFMQGLIKQNVTSTFTEYGWFRHEAGALIKWGYVGQNVNAFSSEYNVTFKVAKDVPVFAAGSTPLVFLNILTPSGIIPSVSLATPTTNKGFTYYTNATTVQFNVMYLAIGV